MIMLILDRVRLIDGVLFIVMVVNYKNSKVITGLSDKLCYLIIKYLGILRYWMVIT